MRPRRFRVGLRAAIALACLLTTGATDGQVVYSRGYTATRGMPRTYGPGMSFGEFGARLNYGEAFGNPYGGINRLGYMYGVAPGFGPFPPTSANPADYVAPGSNPSFSQFYPPWNAYQYYYQNPAVFPPGSPNWGPSGRGEAPPPARPPGVRLFGRRR